MGVIGSIGHGCEEVGRDRRLGDGGGEAFSCCTGDVVK